jgi:hypothetical protein
VLVAPCAASAPAVCPPSRAGTHRGRRALRAPLCVHQHIDDVRDALGACEVERPAVNARRANSPAAAGRARGCAASAARPPYICSSSTSSSVHERGPARRARLVLGPGGRFAAAHRGRGRRTCVRIVSSAICTPRCVTPGDIEHKPPQDCCPAGERPPREPVRAPVPTTRVRRASSRRLHVDRTGRDVDATSPGSVGAASASVLFGGASMHGEVMRAVGDKHRARPRDKHAPALRAPPSRRPAAEPRGERIEQRRRCAAPKSGCARARTRVAGTPKMRRGCCAPGKALERRRRVLRIPLKRRARTRSAPSCAV